MNAILKSVALFCVSVLPACCQCTDGTTLEHITDNIVRTGGNQIFSFAQSWVSGDYASVWTVYAAAQITQNGGSLHSGSDTEGSGSTAQVYWYDTLQTIGPGYFAEADQHRFTNGCGTNDYYPYTDINLTVSRPTISPPAGTYGANQWAMWYMNGLSSPGGFLTSANLTVTTNLGSCGGCSPTYAWVNTDNSGAVSFSSTSSTSTTITSQRASGGATYDTSVNFSMDGFYADSKLWLNLNTPVDFVNNSATDNDDGTCSGYGSYDSRYQYVPYDLWSYATGQIVLNEVNDAFDPTYSGTIVGWYLSGSWGYNDNWPPAFWDDTYHFTDHLQASDCGAWTPHTASPSGGTVNVFQVPQTFYVGSATSGTGVATHSDTQYFYTDHGTVTVP